MPRVPYHYHGFDLCSSTSQCDALNAIFPIVDCDYMVILSIQGDISININLNLRFDDSMVRDENIHKRRVLDENPSTMQDFH